MANFNTQVLQQYRPSISERLRTAATNLRHGNLRSAGQALTGRNFLSTLSPTALQGSTMPSAGALGSRATETIVRHHRANTPQGTGPVGALRDAQQGQIGQFGGQFGGQTGAPDPMSLLRESLEARRDSTRRAGEQSFRDLGDTFQTGAQSLVERLRQGQRNINMGRQNVALDRMRSIDDLVRNIRQGVQSGGIQMSGAGILPGSAPQALARDFGQFGTQQRGQIMRDAGLQMRELDMEQEDLGRLRDVESEQLRRSKETETARIRNDLNDKLLAIEFEARQGGLTDFQARNLRDQIVNEGIQRLMQLDSWLKQQVGGIQPQDRRAVEAEAHRIARENQAPGGFDFTAPGVGVGGGQAPGFGMGAGLGVSPDEELLARPGRLEDEF